MNCDNCSHYCWYYDRCEKWDCEVDGREVNSCFEPYVNRASGTWTCTELEQVMNK